MKPESADRAFKITRLFAVAVLVLFALHQASWLNADPHLIAGLPAGLAYHVGYCLVVAAVFGLFIYRKKR